MKFFPTMDYIALNIQTQDEEQSEILMALLSDWPFDSFDEQEKLLHAYIREKDYTECRVQVEAQLNEMAVPFSALLIAIGMRCGNRISNRLRWRGSVRFGRLSIHHVPIFLTIL